MTEVSPDYPVTLYKVNTENIITEVNDAWISFAHNNEWFIERNDVVGTLLWNYIENDEVKHLYRLAMDRVYDRGSSISFKYRCDSPGMRRYMLMRIDFDSEYALFNFENTVLRIEYQEFIPLLRHDAKRSKKSVCICSWCKKIHVQPGQWLDIEQGINLLDLLSENQLPIVSHGVCPECRNKMQNS